MRVEIERRPRIFLIDTGSSLSLIQPGVCSTPVKPARVSPHGITGDELQVKGEQFVKFKIKGEMYNHGFCVCSLSTDADAIVGTDFLRVMNAKLNLSEEKLWLQKGVSVKHDPFGRRQRESRGTAARAALTIFSATDSHVKPNSCLISYREKIEEQSDQKGANNPEMKILESEPWLVRTTETIRISPRVKQMVVGRLELSKRQQSPPLVCVEAAQLPFESVLAARGLSRVLPTPSRTDETRVTSRRACVIQLTDRCLRDRVHVILANVGQEEIVLPKATVIGVAEEISPSVVANINDDEGHSNTPHEKQRMNVRRDAYSVAREVKFKRDLDRT